MASTSDFFLKVTHAPNFDAQRIQRISNLDPNKVLQEIITEINLHVFDLESQLNNSWFGFGANHFYRVSHSWMRITNDLQIYMDSPEEGYDYLMTTILKELDKFPSRSPYARYLYILGEFIEKSLLLQTRE